MTRRRFVLSAVLALVSACCLAASAPAPSRIPRAAVVSSNLASVGYDRASGVLEIEFRDGAVYRYHAVPPEAHRALMAAESKGRYFARKIRGQYRFQRMTEESR